MLPLTLRFFIAMIACAVNERQQRALEYKTEEVLILKDILKAVTGKERIDFTEDQRRRFLYHRRGSAGRWRLFDLNGGRLAGAIRRGPPTRSVS